MDDLLARYDGARGEVEQAVHQLLDELSREELILPLPSGTAASSLNGSPRPKCRSAAASRFGPGASDVYRHGGPPPARSHP